jgi:hypothetical protein
MQLVDDRELVGDQPPYLTRSPPIAAGLLLPRPQLHTQRPGGSLGRATARSTLFIRRVLISVRRLIDPDQAAFSAAVRPATQWGTGKLHAALQHYATLAIARLAPVLPDRACSTKFSRAAVAVVRGAPVNTQYRPSTDAPRCRQSAVVPPPRLAAVRRAGCRVRSERSAVALVLPGVHRRLGDPISNW